MDQLVPVLVVTALIAFIMIKQIKHITENIAEDKNSGESFEKYSKFSVAIQDHVRAIKADLDSSKQSENPKYRLLEGKDEAKALELLSDFLRKLVFFETLLAKQKKSDEIESELFGILSDLDSFLKEFTQEGEKLADDLREELFTVYNA